MGRKISASAVALGHTGPVTTTDDWRMTDHGDNIGLTEAWLWARAARLQARRVQTCPGEPSTLTDLCFFAIAVRNVVRAGEMAARHVRTDEAKDRMGRALATFRAAAPDLDRARNVLEHFDEYAQGVGWLQQPGVKNPVADEQKAQAFRMTVEYYDTVGGRDGDRQRPMLIVGPYRINVVQAAEAASELVMDLHGALASEQGQFVPEGWRPSL